MLEVLFAAAYIVLAVQPDWTWSAHPEAGFKILVPVELQHEAKTIPTDAAQIELHQYRGGSVSDSNSSLAFAIDYYALPAADSAWTEAELQTFFDATVEQLLANFGGELIYKDIRHQAGMEVCVWKGSYDQGRGIVRGNILLYGELYYGLQVFGLEKNKPEAEMTKFLESFRRLTWQEP